MFSHSVVSDSVSDSMDCSPPGSSVHGMLEWARMLEWVAIPFSRGSSDPEIKPRPPTLHADSLLFELPRKPINAKYLEFDHGFVAT